MMSLLRARGTACIRHAAIPLKIGHEKDVPLDLPIDISDVLTVTLTAIAALSGLNLPSADGPAEEKSEIILFPSTAPTATTLSPSDGKIILFQAVILSFPALLTTRIPFEAAISATLVTKAVFPSRSEYL